MSIETINLYPVKIVMNGKEAFVVPNNNCQEALSLVFIGEEASVVHFNGCLCSDCVHNGDELGRDASGLVKDRGYHELSVYANLKYDLRGFVLHAGANGVVVKSARFGTYGTVSPDHDWFVTERLSLEAGTIDRKVLLLELLKSRYVVFATEERKGAEKPAIKRIASLSRKLLPDLDPSKLVDLLAFLNEGGPSKSDEVCNILS